jgi:hypothetical protein
VPELAAKHLELHGLTVDVLDRPREASLEVARIDKTTLEGSRAILEASSTGERETAAHFERATRKLAAGARLVRTEQPLGAIATYLCEVRSDDGFVSCGILPEQEPGEEFVVARVLEPLA